MDMTSRPLKLKRLSGREVISILQKFGFVVASQKGSHVKLARTPPTGDRQILTVPIITPSWTRARAAPSCGRRAAMFHSQISTLTSTAADKLKPGRKTKKKRGPQAPSVDTALCLFNRYSRTFNLRDRK